MTKKEVEEVRNLYKEYLVLQKMIIELKAKTIEFKENNLLKVVPYEDIEQIKISTKEEALRKIYIEKARKSSELFNIKVYMGSYYYYNGKGSDEFTDLNDLLTFENDPKAKYRVFCDIETIGDSRNEHGYDTIYYSQKDQFEEYEKNNTIIVVPNEEIKQSIIEASKYSDDERFYGIDRYFGLYGNMDKNIKFNRKGDIDSFGDLASVQDYFFSSLMNMSPEEAVDKLTKKYKPYRNFYNYDNIEK